MIILATVGFFVFKNKNNKQLVVAMRTDVVQKVAATGKLKPNQEVNLGFDKSGRVGKVYANIGDKVGAGEMIASLEAGDLLADLSKARATLQQEMVALGEVRSTAPMSYGDAYKNLDAAIREGFDDADNAVRNRTDQFFKTPTENPKFEVSFTSGNFVHYFDVPSEKAIELNNGRKQVETILTEWKKRISNLKTENLLSEASKSLNDLNTISGFLGDIASAVNTFTPAEYAYETTVTTYKTAISSARSEVSSAISSIVTAKDKLNTAPILTEGGQFGDVLTQEAKVRQAEAAVSSLEAQLGKTAIKAPFDGVITLQDAKVGGTVSPGETLVSVISTDKMYIEANVSEINIGKISVGNPVAVTLDAFPREEFSGEISYIEPGAVIVDGIVNYKVRVNLSTLDGRIKSGLTANLEMQTAKREGVLAIPVYAVSKEGGGNFVNKVVNGQVQKIPVTLGLTGNNGMVEITSGLSEGDVVEF